MKAVFALICLWPSLAAADGGLTGISPDFTRYRVGKRQVCTLGTVDGTTVFPPDCKDLPPREQRKLALRLPRGRSTIPLADGSVLLARVTLRPRTRDTGDVACLTRKGERCPTAEEVNAMEALMPQAADLVVVRRAPDGRETVLASSDGTAREVDALYASPSGAQVIVVFRYEKVMRDAPSEAPIGVGVLGLDLRQPATK